MNALAYVFLVVSRIEPAASTETKHPLEPQASAPINLTGLLLWHLRGPSRSPHHACRMQSPFPSEMTAAAPGQLEMQGHGPVEAGGTLSGCCLQLGAQFGGGTPTRARRMRFRV